MTDVVIVSAVRSPIGRRGGGLSGVHPAELLGAVQRAAVERSGLESDAIGQVVGGCVGQVGEQAMNIARTAWLGAGLPLTVAATTIDAQCGSSQQATALAAGLVASGAVEAAMACGVESMSRIPMGSNADGSHGSPVPRTYEDHFRWTTQFEGAELVAERWGITREDADAFGLRSQERAARASSESAFDDQLVAIATADGTTVTRDEGPRASTPEGLANLKPVSEGGVHTAGNASQISDGASAVVLTTAERAAAEGLTPLARIVDTCLVGSDPVLMLTGPIPATQRLLENAGMAIGDVDVFEINEAFASVVLAWERELGADPERVNPNGGAIALGHPLGSTGAGLITKAVHELHRGDGERAIVAMCCGGGLGTGMLLERL
jgi:acetyl-CoA C-acetyltransferase